ncbi:MAG TPA: PEP-utilizing enzyme, partial [Chryseosolibacter sp.]|nr:PEP-utilizing enzyme [Chryseosolibacter sp.]
ATIVDRGDFINPLSHDGKEFHAVKSNKGMSAAEIQAQAGNDPAIVIELMRRTEVSLDELRKKIETKSGSALFDFILADIHELKRLLFDPQSFAVFKSAMDASAWINDHINEWLGEKNAADALSQSVPNNITSEMGLAMLDVADVIRPFPQVIDFLEHTSDDHFLDELVRLDGGLEASNAIRDFLSKYGMRCSGEIDITKDRWSEKPISLVPLIISNMKNFQQGESKRRFERGRKEALKKEQALLELLRQLPDGEQKVRDTREMISLVRNFIGYREYPKYGMVNRYFIYKQALLKEAEKLVEAKLIRETQDIFYLTFEELREVVHSKKLDYEIIQKRIDEYTLYARLTPPRVITSDGEIIAGQYKREDIPNGAIPGLAVSSGVVEGRARVILSMEDAELEEGDILVTRFTDPGWTALFVSIKGLITEVGGLMTHGAVVAREYGLPAVVGVQDATTLIKDGQRIRVHGTEGYVEIL